MDNKWYKNGIRFECQGSGKCCSSRGEYGYVYLTNDDRQNMANELNLSLNDFTKKHCGIDDDEDFYHLNMGKSPNCIFLKDNKCSVYKARPTQCRTWPFWPETMDAKVWKKEVAKFCPGVDKGRLYSQREIEEILNEQVLAETTDLK
jgi:Fe-S-cluster containining protein